MITDDEIRTLRTVLLKESNNQMTEDTAWCGLALRDPATYPPHVIETAIGMRMLARERCAELLNALAVSPTAVTCGYEPCDGGPCEYPVEHAAREASYHASERAARKEAK